MNNAYETWRIDPEHSTLRFRIRHAIVHEIEGQFHCWGGTVLIGEGARGCSVRAWADLSSIDTGSARRDNYILATELFDVNAEPALVFDSDQVEVSDTQHVVVVGWLSVHSFRQHVAVAIESTTPPPEARGAERMNFIAHASVDRRALGLRRSKHTRDLLGEQVLGTIIDIEARIEVARETRRAPRLPGDRAAGVDAPQPSSGAGVS